MKYLIPLYFILFLSIFTIINVFSSSIQVTTTKPLAKTVNKWRPLNASLGGKMVQRLGKEAVETYNKRHPKRPQLSYINVTKGLKTGKKAQGNKKIKLKILVSKTDNTVTNSLTCQNLVAIFNVSTNGTKTLFKSRLKPKVLECSLNNISTRSPNSIRGDLKGLVEILQKRS